MNESTYVQDLHSLIREGISLHGDRNLNSSHEFFGLVLIPIKQFGISSLGASGQVVRGLDGYVGLGIHCNSLCHCGCCSWSHIGNVITCVCNPGLEEGIQFLELLQLLMLAFKEVTIEMDCFD